MGLIKYGCSSIRKILFKICEQVIYSKIKKKRKRSTEKI